MQEKLTVTERKPSIWKTVIISSLIAVISCTVLFIWSTDPLWTGIWRLTAFAAFAVLVLAYLQKRGNEKKIELEFKKGQLIISYFGDSKKEQEELFELETIKTVKRIKEPVVWGFLPAKKSSKFIISFTDTSNFLSLFRIEGRDMLVSPEDADQIEKFLDQKMEIIT